MNPSTETMVCAGCGYRVPLDERFPFRCPQARSHDDIDHVLTRVFDSAAVASLLETSSEPSDRNPFVRYRRLFHSYHVGRAGGLSDQEYVAMVRELDAKVAEVDGEGFRVTPLVHAHGIQNRLGIDDGGSLWIKNETVNVSGTHKGRHLMGILIWLGVMERLGPAGSERKTAPRLAIASCGNAALAAAVLARASGHELDVFVPPDADASVLGEIQRLGAQVSICPRGPEGEGDPCVGRFRAAVASGALPFACQGNENGLTIEGGKTLGYEVVESMVAQSRHIDRFFVQVGGGALASSCLQAFRDEKHLGRLEQQPRFHAVQTKGAYPLRIAYDRLVERILERCRQDATGSVVPTEGIDGVARFIAEDVPQDVVEGELRYAATHRSSFMTPWPDTPHSLADAILDDETYDWLAVVRGMLETGGFPVVVTEDRLSEAHRTAHRHTKIAVDPTGTAGLAGALELAELDLLGSDENVVVLFTGVERKPATPRP